jgi:tetratricopeptide (TPR) repeat protein
MVFPYVGNRLRLAITFAIILSSECCYSQANVDSLLRALDKNPKADTTRVLILNRLAFENYYNNPLTSLQYGFESLNIADSLQFTRGQADAFRQIGLAFWAQADMSTAVSYYLVGLKIAEVNHHKQVEADIVGNIGTAYNGLGNPKEALTFLFRSRDMQQALNNEWREASVLNNIGDAYMSLKNPDKAAEAYTLALNFSRRIGYPLGVTTNTRNLGNVFEQKGNYDSALANYFKCIELSSKINDNRGYILSNKSIASVYMKTGKINLAEKFARASLNGAMKVNLRAFMRDNYELLAKIAEAQGNKTEALDFFKLYAAYKDSVQNLRVVSDVAAHRLRFETERKQNEIELLKKDAEMQVSEITEQRTRFIFVSIILGLAILLSFVSIRNYKRIKTKNGLLREKNLEINKQNLKLSEQHNELVALNEEIRAQQEETMTQRDALAVKNVEVENMSRKLMDANEGLENIVEQRTFALKEKNKKLEEYAYFNAHKLRAPVASILGLIGVFYQTNSPTDKEQVIAHLKQSSENLDEVIKSINNTLEDGLEGRS